MFGLSIAAWITIVTLVTLVVLFATTKTPPEFLYLGALTVLLVTGVVSEQTALSGFASDSVLATGAESVMVVGLVQSGAMMWVVQKVLGHGRAKRSSLLKIMIPSALVSTVMANAGVATMFVNIIKAWSKKIKVPQSKLLIPMAYATMLGGSCTLIGSASNLIIAGLYAEETGVNLGMFSITLPGVFCLVVGMASIVLLHKLLPERKSASENFDSTGDYTVELLVPTDNAAVGQTVSEARLDNVPGGRLIEIVRFDEEVISPVPADEFILGGDHLVYSGEIDEILNLRRTHGLVNAHHHVFSTSEVDKNRKLRTAVVRYHSSLVGKSIGETDFEEKYNMILVAVSRQGERIASSPRDITIMPDDTLLLECPPKEKKVDNDNLRRELRFFDSDDTVVVSSKSIVAFVILAAMLLLHVMHLLTVLESCLVAAAAMLIFNCCTAERAKKGIEWDILIIMACSVVFGKAVLENGIADKLASIIGSVTGDNSLVMMFTLCFAAMVAAEFFSSSATSAIFFPIVYQSAVSIGCDPLPFCIALMLAVSTSYTTPMGSPAMLVIYGPGSYRFQDLLRIGIPMKLIMLIAILFIVNVIY